MNYSLRFLVPEISLIISLIIVLSAMAGIYRLIECLLEALHLVCTGVIDRHFVGDIGHIKEVCSKSTNPMGSSG